MIGRWLRVGWLGFGLMLACEHDPEMDRIGGPLPDSGSGGSAGSAGSGGTGGVGGTAGAAGGDVDGGDSGPPCPIIDPAIVTPAIPCDIEDILQAKCQRCHQSPPQNGAPFQLLQWEDTQKVYLGKPIHLRMFNAVTSGFMPFTALPLDPPVEPLTPAEKTKLLDWLSQCGPPVEATACP